MDRAGKEKQYALISAFCFIIHALCDIAPSLDFIRTNDGLIAAAVILEWISFTLLAVTVLVINKKAVLIAAGIHFLAVLAFFLIEFDPDWLDWRRVFFMMAYASLAITVVCSGKDSRLAGKIWFFPGAFLFLAWASQIGYQYIFSMLGQWSLTDCLYVISGTAALVFAGLWLKNDPTPVRTSVSS